MPRGFRTTSRRFRTGGPPLTPEEKETGVERRSPRQPQQQRVPRTTFNQLLDVAARSIIEGGDIQQFWDFVQEARRFGSIPPQWTDEVLQAMLEDNRQSLDRRIFALQEEFTMMGEPSEFGPEVKRRVFQQMRSARQRTTKQPPSFPDDPLKRGPVFGE